MAYRGGDIVLPHMSTSLKKEAVSTSETSVNFSQTTAIFRRAEPTWWNYCFTKRGLINHPHRRSFDEINYLNQNRNAYSATGVGGGRVLGCGTMRYICRAVQGGWHSLRWGGLGWRRDGLRAADGNRVRHTCSARWIGSGVLLNMWRAMEATHPKAKLERFIEHW